MWNVYILTMVANTRSAARNSSLNETNRFLKPFRSLRVLDFGTFQKRFLDKDPDEDWSRLIASIQYTGAAWATSRPP